MKASEIYPIWYQKNRPFAKQVGSIVSAEGFTSAALELVRGKITTKWNEALVTLLRPSMSLLPLGHLGSRSWAARNANLASQTLMLAASAKGIDSCPMEGFSASKVAAILGLPRGAVVPVAIALGYRTDDARTEPQWRRALADVIVEH